MAPYLIMYHGDPNIKGITRLKRDAEKALYGWKGDCVRIDQREAKRLEREGLATLLKSDRDIRQFIKRNVLRGH